MIIRATVSAFLVAIISLIATLLVQNADLNMVYAAFCCSPYFIVIALIYFYFNFFRKKLKVLEKPKFAFELGYGFLFYCLFSLLLPVLLFLSTWGDEYEHRLYADLGGVIKEMFPLILTLSIFLTFFSSVIITWAIKSWKYLVPTLLGYLILLPIIFAFSTTIREFNDLREERLTQEDNIREGRYKWFCAMSNPAAYPVQLYSGRFIFPKDEDYEFTFSEGNIVNYNAVWGQAGGGTYEQVMSLPKALDVTWYSFAEDVFYRMNGPIDYSKLRRLFSTPYQEKGAIKTNDEHYNKIILGFAPGGVLVVWASGTGRRQVEIGRYQAEKVVIHATDTSKDNGAYGNVFNQEWRDQVLSDYRLFLRMFNKPLQINLFPMATGINYGNVILYSLNLYCLLTEKHLMRTWSFIIPNDLSLMSVFGIWTWHLEVFPKMCTLNGMINIITDVLRGFCLMKLRHLRISLHFLMTKRTLGLCWSSVLTQRLT
ncbi:MULTISPECIES: DUF2931 family protein [Sphingobacterium]|uniref:DUF2931 family protein n=1 Tax=Sphingobacterium multivorum TaxID=28454 RepID=A0A653Y900_SPHMU|nr:MULTISPECIES: DUF2931 family protein [Sphingobacterium]HAE68606.1 DUF2931 domain-containing protein [Sphingobacterium sp.]OFV12306.1 hypothetical protein HMPREF3127_16885 [Sphingobacterium sp. HMSC13C05]VXC38957.1 conserved membrane hypothetical protein [Sphingobacterium multivorum]HAL54159.1 DUF2931 domain-containing protein [Sphingobacterium sp.]HAT93990.1 DUF2931 domain-containing protein [Sphingobacterium sp.]